MELRGLITKFRLFARVSGPPESPVPDKGAPIPNSVIESGLATGAEHASISGHDFFILWVELGLILAAAFVLKVEQTHGLPRILPVVFLGFALNAWAPLRYRPSVFLLLGIASIVLILGPWDSLWLFGLGVILIAICQLPWSMGLRVGLLLCAGALLAAVRLQWFNAPGSEHLALVVLPMLGAMFMFRLVVYLHDRQHERQESPLPQRLAYFFLLPNSCFPLFPVIDYDRFCRNYYNAKAVLIYQKGARWIMRGIIHLAIYRLVYYHFTPTFDEINDLLGAGQYVVSSYFMYLRVSGMFHIIVGTLCLFGFNLSETNRLYFLSSSFTDFWRRINIYWKDFMMKILYYPLFVRLKGAGVPIAIAGATFVTLIVSWLLHSYQIFWLRGSFPLLIQDAVFWTFLGVAVAINALIEYKSGRVRASKGHQWNAWAAFILSLKTVAMFCVMSLLWSFWTSSSVTEWVAIMNIGFRSSDGEKLVLVGIIGTAIVIGTLWQILMRRSWVLSAEQQPPFLRAAASTSIVAALALLIVLSGEGGHLGPDAQNVLASLRANRPNLRDQELEMRGYYEQLLGAEVASQAVWHSVGEAPRNWDQIRNSDAARDTHDARRYELRPNVDVEFKGARLRTNSYGMRDREYPVNKPLGTFRIALFGDSYTMGAGVGDSDDYSTLLENHLNRERPLEAFNNYEVLNFAVGGYSAIQSALGAKVTVPMFDPDVVMYATAHDDLRWATLRLAYAVEEGASLDEPFLVNIRERTGISSKLNHYELRRRLKPVASELVEWAYATMVATAASNGAQPVWVFLPRLGHDPNAERRRYETTSELARSVGFVTYSMEELWSGHNNVEALYIAPWDRHPNPTGHAMIAERLYAELATDWTILAPVK
jgi:lysophospholipase L1-like esterase